MEGVTNSERLRQMREAQFARNEERARALSKEQLGAIATDAAKRATGPKKTKDRRIKRPSPSSAG